MTEKQTIKLLLLGLVLLLLPLTIIKGNIAPIIENYDYFEDYFLVKKGEVKELYPFRNVSMEKLIIPREHHLDLRIEPINGERRWLEAVFLGKNYSLNYLSATTTVYNESHYQTSYFSFYKNNSSPIEDPRFATTIGLEVYPKTEELIVLLTNNYSDKKIGGMVRLTIDEHHWPGAFLKERSFWDRWAFVFYYFLTLLGVIFLPVSLYYLINKRVRNDD